MCDIYVCMYVCMYVYMYVYVSVCMLHMYVKCRVTGVQMISYIIIVDRTKSVNFPLFGLSSKAEGETVSVHLPHPFTHIPGAAP